MYSEDRIQQEQIIWFRNKYTNLRKCIFSIPNGGYRNKVEAKILKATGLTAGVSDLIFIYKGVAYFIENKTEIGAQSNEQIEFERVVIEQGFDYFICRSLEDFQKIIISIIGY